MLPETQPADRIAFGSFELETASGELFRDGRRIRLSGQPADLLVMLVRRSGHLVSREELRVALWPEDTFVDFDHGLNNCIRRIRDALGDPSDSPRFIETLPKKGYRFIAETRPVLPPQNVLTFPVLESAALEPETADTTPIHEDVLQVPISRWKRLRPWAISLFTIVVALFLFFVGSLILKHRSKPADFHSVVLLPLTNLSGDSSQDYLSDGVTDELITELAQATGVPVISRTSAMVYKGKQKTIPVIARELGVDAVVEGALNRTGDRLRMTVHLIDGARDKSLWAQSYDGDMSNVRELEIKVAADLAAHLRAPTTTRTPIGSPRPIAPEAYEEYLKGQYFWGRFELWPALRHFERAAAIEPGYAAAYSGIAKTYCLLEYQQALPPDVAFSQASKAVEKAFSLDKQNGEAHAAHVYVLIQRDWNWPEGEAENQRAIAINPSNSFIYRWYSYILLQKGRKADSLRQIQIAARLDPASSFTLGNYADRLLRVGNFKESIEQFQAAIELDPAGSDWRFRLAEALEKSGQLDRAATELGEAYIIRGEPDIASEFKQQYPVSGYTKAAAEAQRVHLLRELQKLENKRVKGEYVSPTAYTNIYAGLKNREETLRWLDEAYWQHSHVAVELLDERFDFIRHDPHFESIFRSIPFYH
jgi:TolB-like protein/DNA-binding winged helix-turn-helix (wHTH) protein/Tfp pilus assembly protein PilF